MGFFTQTTKTIDLVGGNTVVLRKATFGDSQAASSAAMQVKPDATLSLDWPRYRLELLARCLVSWEGPDFEGRQPTRENVEALPPKMGSELADAVEELGRQSANEGN